MVSVSAIRSSAARAKNTSRRGSSPSAKGRGRQRNQITARNRSRIEAHKRHLTVRTFALRSQRRSNRRHSISHARTTTNGLPRNRESEGVAQGSVVMKTLVVWIIGATAVLAFGFWRYNLPPLPLAHIALLYDRSESMPQGCDALIALGQRALTLPHVREGSTLALFTTGDKARDSETEAVDHLCASVVRLATESLPSHRAPASFFWRYRAAMPRCPPPRLRPSFSPSKKYWHT